MVVNQLDPEETRLATNRGAYMIISSKFDLNVRGDELHL